MKTNLFILISGIFIGLIFSACGTSDEVELTGESAFDYIRKDRSVAPTTDVQAIDDIMDWAIEDYEAKRKKLTPEGRAKLMADRLEPSESVMKLLKKTTKPRKNIDTDSFERVDFLDNGYTDPEEEAVGKLAKDAVCGGVDLGDLEDEFYVDHMEAIPVRNQGRRGTCAAFTGIGHLEYAALKEYSNLPTMDLSEQRFYYNSKPECQSSGCSTNEQGSWYGEGMEVSLKGSGPDIPLEADCPYASSLGDTDLQTPQLPTCGFGALQVKELDYVTGPKEIVEALHKTKLPVPFASPLSGNWEQNKGLITYAESNYQGDTSHAGGHAYLIVGYKKLKNMNDECGMCFVIKNSWGTGWGVNGYSCMTLKWVQEWTFGGRHLTHPMAMKVLLREDLQEAEELPNNDEVEDETAPDVPDESETDENDKSDSELDGELDELPEPEPEPSLSWTEAKLFGPGESYYRAEYAEDGGKAYVRAILREEKGYTSPLELDKSSAKLMFEGDKVGEKSGEELYLCSGEFDLICSLRFDPQQNSLFIEFPYPDNRKVKEDEMPSGKWLSFGIPLGDQEVELYNPNDVSWTLTNAKAFVRLKKSGSSTTEPVRLSVSGTDIKAMGSSIGSLDPSNPSLCTGKFETACGIFSLGEELNILPSW